MRIPRPMGGAGVPARSLEKLAALLEVVGDQRGQLVVAAQG